jgi:HEPN domain-containing protein
VENAAKALLAVLGPVGRTHRPAVFLREAMADGRFTPAEVPSVEKVAACAEELGHDIHARSDYGDETDFRTPWEIFGEEDGREALAIAEVAVFQAGLVAEGVDRR